MAKDSSTVHGENTIPVRIPYNDTVEDLKVNLEDDPTDDKRSAAELFRDELIADPLTDEEFEHIIQAIVVLRAANENLSLRRALRTATVMWFG